MLEPAIGRGGHHVRRTILAWWFRGQLRPRGIGPGANDWNDQQCRSLVYPLDFRADDDDCSQVDVDGTPYHQNIRDVAVSEADRGYTSYIWQNPATEEHKLSYVVDVELDGETVSVGAGLYGLE